MSEKPVVVHQFLHGYKDGHQLIASSTTISARDERMMLILSDMSGPDFVGSFGSYLTGYPLIDSPYYAIARTWDAPEMPRRGCVWTHTLLVPYDFCYSIDIGVLKSFFKRPDISADDAYYFQPLHIGHANLTSSKLLPPINICAQIVADLYNQPNKFIVIGAQNETYFEDLVVCIWQQQWPGLRKQFRFCTGSMADRSVNDWKFDLQVVPVELLQGFGDSKSNIHFFNQHTIEEGSSSAIHAVSDLAQPGHLKAFLNVSGEGGRENYFTFIQYFEMMLNHTDVKHWIHTACNKFPSQLDGKRLKKNVFGAQKMRAAFGFLISEKEMLTALAQVASSQCFCVDDLELEVRVTELLSYNKGNAIPWVRSLIGPGFSDIGLLEFKIALKSLNTHDTIDLILREPFLVEIVTSLHPIIVADRTFHTLPKHTRQAAVAVLNRSVSDDDIIVRCFHSLVLNSEDAFMSDVMSLVNEKRVISICELMADDNEFSERLFTNGWYRGLSDYHNILFPHAESTSRAETFTIVCALVRNYQFSEFLTTVHSHQKFLLDRRKLSQSVEIRSKCIAFSAGVHNQHYELLCFAAPALVQAAGDNQLPYDSWLLVEPYAPSVSWFGDWDKCERLLMALIKPLFLNDSLIITFLISTFDETFFLRVVNELSRSSEGMGILRKMKNELHSNKLKVDHGRISLINLLS